MVVSPEVAGTWLANHNYEHQRQVRPTHVKTLTKEMQEGRFRQKTQVNFCRLNDVYALTNGQHTLNAIVQSGCAQLLNVVVLDVDNTDQIADDFARHDTHLTRRISDSLVAHEMDKYFGVTRTMLNQMTAGAMFYAYMNGEITQRSAHNLSHDAKLIMLKKHGELARDAMQTLPSLTKSQSIVATRKTTVAAMMIVYKYSPSMCVEFYGGMFLDDGLRRGDPRKTLLTYFRETKTAGGASNTMSEAKRAVADHMLVKAQALAFNAFAARKDLLIIRPNFESKTVEFKNIGVFSC